MVLQSENERLERSNLVMQKSKEFEKDKLLKEFQESDIKKKDSIHKLKETLNKKEIEFKNNLTNLTEQNKTLKDNLSHFERYKEENSGEYTPNNINADLSKEKSDSEL